MVEEYKPVLSNRKFVYVWVSQILSQLTINIMNFLLLTKLFSATGSAIATSFLWVSYALPAILIGPFAAVSIDLLDKRKVLIITNLLQSAVIFGYALIHQEKTFLLYGVAFTYSLFNQFYLPAETSAIPSVVETKLLPHANALFFITQQVAIILGFGLAGILANTLGYSTSFFLCALFLFLAFLSVSFLPPMPAGVETTEKIEEGITGFFSRIFEGYRFIRENRQVLMPFLLLVSLQIILAVIAVNVPAFATQIFKINLNLAGPLVMVPAGIGAAIGALYIPKILRKGTDKKKMIEVSLMSLIFDILLIAFLIPELGNIARIVVGIGLIILTGVSFVGILIPSQTFIQEATPGGLRGRVFGNFWFLVTIATILPVIFSGAITEILGLKTLLTLIAGALLAYLIKYKK